MKVKPLEGNEPEQSQSHFALVIEFNSLELIADMPYSLGNSDMDVSDAEPANRYPLEGKYKDATDRARSLPIHPFIMSATECGFYQTERIARNAT